MVIGTPVVLNLIPGGVNKVVHVNQVNDNIEIQFQIMNGSQPYNVTEGVSCTIRGTKGDSYGYTAEAATTVGSNVVTVTLTEQLTAVAGGCNVFELVFVGTENSMKVSTENFILAVERAALGEDTVISDSDLAYAAQVLDQLQSVGAVNAQVQQNKAIIAAETTRATAAEQTLQQNINSEASARQSADNTLQSNINAEASTRATQDASLQSQINQLVAPSGEAPSAAEVENARVGADGTVYSTLGDAIRTQVTDVKSQIGFPAINVGTITDGAYIAPLGQTAASSGSAYSDYVEVIPGSKIRMSDVYISGYRSVCAYDADKTMISGSAVNQSTATEIVYNVPDNAKYVRATTKASNNLRMEYIDLYGYLLGVITDKTASVDGIDAVTAVANTGYIQTNNGLITNNANYSYVEFPVTGGAKVFYKTKRNESSQIGIGFYTAEDVFISGVNATNTEQEIDVPDGAWLARASYVSSEASEFYVKIAATFQNLLSASYGNALKLRGAVPSFVLPSASTAVVGHEYNIYFDNVIRGMDFEKYAIKVNISPTPSNVKLYEKLLRITPTQNDIGVKTVTIEIRTKNGYILIASQTLTLHIVADRTFSGKRVLFLGDSLTNAGIFAAEIQDVMTSEGIESVGTRSTTCRINGVDHTVNHEGRPGWAAYDYTRSVTNYKTDFDNPFWDGEKFSFAYYMANSGVSVPDVVCVGLGTNGYNNNGINAMRTIVDSIHAYNANIPVIVSLIAMPATQDGVGYTVKLQSAADLHDKFLTVNAVYISDYEGNLSRPNTCVADLYFNLDSEHDFTTVEIPLSSRNPGMWTIQNNNVHPSEYGYLKFADAYYNQIVAVMP